MKGIQHPTSPGHPWMHITNTTTETQVLLQDLKVRNVQTRTIVCEHDFKNTGALTTLG